MKEKNFSYWEDLWKQALHEHDIEIAHIQPPREKSTLQKVSQSKHFHRFGAICRASKALTSELKSVWDPVELNTLNSFFLNLVEIMKTRFISVLIRLNTGLQTTK